MNDKIVFGQYINKDSWIHRLDPRCKIITLFMMMVGVFLIQNLYALLIVLGLIILIVFTSKIPITKFLKSLRMIALLLIFTAAFQIIFNKVGNVIEISGKPLSFDFTLTWINLGISVLLLVIYILVGKYLRGFKLLVFVLLLALAMCLQVFITKDFVIVTYNISIHEGGFNTAVMVLLRVLNLVVLSALLTFTTKPTDLNGGIEGIFAPFKFAKKGVSIIAMMMSIALRFIPTLINETQKILKAQASRGVDFNDGKLKEKVMQIVSLLVPMFVTSYKKAEDLANAMEARGYIPGEDRTRIYELKYHVSDILVYIFLVLFFASIIFLKIRGII